MAIEKVLKFVAGAVKEVAIETGGGGGLANDYRLLAGVEVLEY